MARYFFDTDNGDRFDEDEDGMDLDGLESARRQAQAALADMARDLVPRASDPERMMTVRVKDEAGKTVLKAALVLRVEVEP